MKAGSESSSAMPTPKLPKCSRTLMVSDVINATLSVISRRVVGGVHFRQEIP